MAPMCQYIVVQLNDLLPSLEMVSEMAITTNNTTSKLTGYIVAHQVPTHKYGLTKKHFWRTLHLPEQIPISTIYSIIRRLFLQLIDQIGLFLLPIALVDNNTIRIALVWLVPVVDLPIDFVPLILFLYPSPIVE